ncbi:MAG: tetratricopeptide repeat protein [Desulfovermiculus sp.]
MHITKWSTMYGRQALSLLAILTVFWSGWAMAQDQVKLLATHTQPGLNRTLITFEFTQAPEFEVDSSGQKVDVTFRKARTGDSFEPLSSGWDIVDFLTARESDDLRVSILLRRPPERVETMTRSGSKVQLKLSWPEAAPQSRPGITLDPGGDITAQQGEAVAGRFLTSRYSQDWARFIVDYESQVELKVPMSFSFMPYPMALSKAEESRLSKAVREAAANAQWSRALRALQETDPDFEQEFPGLTAEFLFRSGNVLEAGKAMDSIFQPGVDERKIPGRLHLLRAYILLSQQRPYLAYCYLFSEHAPQELSLRVDQYWRLAQIEAALSTGRPVQALELAEKYKEKYLRLLPSENDAEASDTREGDASAYLGDQNGSGQFDQGIPPPIVTRQGQIHIQEEAGKTAFVPGNEEKQVRERIDLRRIQSLLALNENEQAWGAVHNMRLWLSRMLQTPQAMAQLADLFYLRKQYNQARPFYSQLASVLDSDEDKALALWRAAMCLKNSGYRGLDRRLLQEVLDEYPETGGGFRARMTLNDLNIEKSLPQIKMEAVNNYAMIAEQAPQRTIREEARLKHIAAMYESGELEKAADSLSQFLIHFAAGPLYHHAQALLAEIVPDLVPKLLDNDRVVTGLAMVARNRDLLIQSDMPQDFLLAIGDAFTELGLVRRSSRVFLYMLSRAENDNQRGMIYERLIDLWSRQGLSTEALQYAEMYAANFPQGKYRKKILALGVESLLDDDQPDKALDYLLDSTRPVGRNLDVLTAKALYAVGDYQRMDRYLERADMPQEPLPPEIRLAWGRAKASLGETEQALALLQSLRNEDSQYAYPALYQAAELLADTEQYTEAIKTYTELADKGEGTMWAELAREGAFLAKNAEFLLQEEEE